VFVGYGTRDRGGVPARGQRGWTALRALTARPGLAAHPALLAEVLAASGHAERLGAVLDELRRSALLEARSPERPSPIVARIAERHDPDPMARSAVAALIDAAYDGHLHTGRPRGRGMSEATIAVAFTLQVELSTRIATRPLPEGQGLLSEALGSLKALFDAARAAIKELGSANRDDEVALLAGKLCETLRPFLTEWHPRLDDHLSTRPPGVGVLTHERAWDQAAALRAELPGLQATLNEVLDRLREITGADL
jgi:hypothetical protein